jgi:hypothetical protein
MRWLVFAIYVPSNSLRISGRNCSMYSLVFVECSYDQRLIRKKV